MLAACSAGAPRDSNPAPVASPAATEAPAPPASGAPAPAPAPVFLVVMENRSYEAALAGPFTASLAARYGLATDYHAVAHPSLPNYLALSSGSTWGITDDGYHQLAGSDLGAQLTGAGVPWRAYMEGMTRGCFDSPYPYALKHNPFAYYGGRCPEQVVALDRLDGDLAGATPRFTWITPDLCHDGHDCSTADADRFLQALVPRVTESAAWKSGGVLFITWDEDDGSAGNHVPLLVVSPLPLQHTIAGHLTHYSLLAAVEDMLGVPRLREAVRAQPLTLS